MIHWRSNIFHDKVGLVFQFEKGKIHNLITHSRRRLNRLDEADLQMSSNHIERQVSVGDVLGDRYRVEKKLSKKDKCTYVVADTKNNDEM